MHCIALQTRHSGAGEYYCSGSCYQVSCATLALLEVATPPTILLSSEAKTVVPASLTLVVAYGLPVAFNLLPCPSFGRSAVQGYRLLLCVVLMFTLQPYAHSVAVGNMAANITTVGCCIRLGPWLYSQSVALH